MSRMFSLYGVGQALFSVLPPPLLLENAPTSSMTNYEIGQMACTPPNAPTAFYLYAGGGVWAQFASNSGDIIAVVGTANQITASTSAGTATLSIPTAFTAPGSITSTTTMTAGTSLTAGTTITATLGNITATNGNLVLSAAGNKLVIHATTATTDSVGVTAVMSGNPGAVTVTSTAVTTSSKIIYARATTGGTAGEVAISAQTTGSFTLTSTSTNETSTFNYLIIN